MHKVWCVRVRSAPVTGRDVVLRVKFLLVRRRHTQGC